MHLYSNSPSGPMSNWHPCRLCESRQSAALRRCGGTSIRTTIMLELPVRLFFRVQRLVPYFGCLPAVMQKDTGGSGSSSSRAQKWLKVECTRRSSRIKTLRLKAQQSTASATRTASAVRTQHWTRFRTSFVVRRAEKRSHDGCY